MLIQKLVSAFVTIWLAATLAFFMLRLLPGDAIETQLAQSGASPTVIQERRAAQGLDDPIGMQYLRFILNLGRGDLGFSLLHGQPVLEMISQRFQPTLMLAVFALVIASVEGVIFGIAIAFPVGWGISTVIRILNTLALSMPIYWSGTLVILFFSGFWNILPNSQPNDIKQLILPASLLGFHTAGAIARMVAAQLQEARDSDFVRTAQAKGLPQWHIINKHILRVGLLPTVSVITLQASFLLSGTVIIESLFVRPGVGRLLFDSTLQQDYPVVQGIAVMTAIIYVLLNTLADVAYSFLDPRVNV